MNKKGVVSGSRKVFGPPGGILLGNYRQFQRDKLGFLSQCVADYGDVVKLHLRKPTFLLTNPEDIKHVLTNSDSYSKTPRLSSTRAQRALGKGILTLSSGPNHRKQRRMLQPLFYQKTIEVFADVIVNVTEGMLGEWKNGTVVDIAEEMKKLAQRIMIKTLLGNDGKDESGALSNAITVRRQYYEYLLGSLFPFPEYVPVQLVRQYPAAIHTIDEVIHRVIQSRRTQEKFSPDMISALVRASYDDGTGMNDHQIREEALTFIDAGYETTAAALTWTWYLLAKHRQAESKLVAELHTVLNGRSISADDLPKLKYANSILAESMRLYPPTWMFVRIVRHKDTLPGGVTLSEGSKLFLCQYLAHRHPDYFPNPEEFEPDRFESLNQTNRSRFAYFPFGGGPHACIGETFARLEILLVLGIIAQRFKLELLPGQKVVADPGIALRPKSGIQMRISTRDNAP